MDVQAYMAERIPLVDAALESRTAARAEVPARLGEAMRHLLFPGGKRLRPVFAMAAAEAVGGDPRAALPIAVAVELVHTYSLVHDDLPCMDDDATRRGRPTVHMAFDEATAVLAGDALLTEAFGALAEDALDQAHREPAIFALARLARAAGAAGLVGGQFDDLDFESDAFSGDGEASRARLASIHARKTAALFQAAIVGGAALAGANPEARAALDDFGREVGMAFQIADDVLDDESGESASILRVEGVEDARHHAEALLERALERLEAWGERAEPLRELARFAVRRDR